VIDPVRPETVSDMRGKNWRCARISAVNDVNRPRLTDLVSNGDRVPASCRIDLQKINFKEIAHPLGPRWLHISKLHQRFALGLMFQLRSPAYPHPCDT
jgi:hypothetical protein